MVQKCSKNRPGRAPAIFGPISLVFGRFFDPATIPKKCQNTSTIKDFIYWKFIFLQIGNPQNAKTLRNASESVVFTIIFKKHREAGGVGGTRTTPGSKLA